MNFKSLLKSSERDRERGKQLQNLITGQDLKSYLQYLLYRIRFPIMGKLLFRFITIFELALIFQLFSFTTFTDLSLFLFVYFLSRQILKNIYNYSRVQISNLLKRNKLYAAQQKFKSLIFLIIFCSVVYAAMAALVISLLAATNDLNFYYTLILVILLPLELISGLLWSIVYLESRLPRKFTLLLGLRLIPILTMVLTYQLGPILYLSAVLLSRSLEKIYLLQVAWKFLKKQGFWESYGQVKVKYQIRLSKLAIKYFIVSSVRPFYYLLTGIIVFSSGEQNWTIYLTYYFLLNFNLFFLTQPSRSLGFDYFKFIQTGQEKLAARLAARLMTITFFCSLLLILASYLVFVNSPYLSLILPSSVAEYFLYFLAALVLQSRYQVIFNLAQIIGQEKYFTKGLLAIQLGLALSSNYIFLIYFDYNLQSVFLIEAIAFFIATIYLSHKFKPILSPIFHEQVRNQITMAPLLANSNFELLVKGLVLSERPYNFYLVVFSEQFIPEDLIKRFSLQKTFYKRFLANSYLFIVAEDQPLPDLMIPYLKFMYKIDLDSNTEHLIDEIYQLFHKYEFYKPANHRRFLKLSSKPEEEELQRFYGLKNPTAIISNNRCKYLINDSKKWFEKYHLYYLRGSHTKQVISSELKGGLVWKSSDCWKIFNLNQYNPAEQDQLRNTANYLHLKDYINSLKSSEIIIKLTMLEYLSFIKSFRDILPLIVTKKSNGREFAVASDPSSPRYLSIKKVIC